MTLPPLTDERLAEIRARYESLRATQSKPGLRTATRGERADIRHRLEREIARQDVPLLLSEVDRLRAERERLDWLLSGQSLTTTRTLYGDSKSRDHYIMTHPRRGREDIDAMMRNEAPRD